jgi:hypothetical protein
MTGSVVELTGGAADPDCFTGATIRLFQVDVLVVYVPRHVVGDRALAPTVVAAFHARFNRTVVLAAQDRRGVPTYFGPAPIATVLSRIPFDALAWRRYRYRKPKPMMLPIPTDPLPEDRDSNTGGWSAWHSDPRSRGAKQRSAGRDPETRNAGRDPATRDSAGRDPATRDSAGRDRATRDLVGRAPVTRDLGGRDPAGLDPVTRDLGGRDSVTRDAAGRDSVTRALAGRDPAGRDPAGRDPAGRDPVTRALPAARDPTTPASALARSNARRTRTLIPDYLQEETRP